MIGPRIDPETGETVEVPESEHFYRCERCGGLVDMRDLAKVMAHEDEGPYHRDPVGHSVADLVGIIAEQEEAARADLRETAQRLRERGFVLPGECPKEDKAQ